MVDLSPYRGSQGQFGFHMTARDNADSIRDEGLQGSPTNNSDTELIAEALASQGYDSEFLFDRTEVIYCHLDPSEVVEAYEISSKFTNNPVVVVVDLGALSTPLYLADMTVANELIDHHVAPNAPTATETFDEAVRQYRESIIRLDGISSIRKQQEKIDGYPELVIGGDVPPKAIVESRPA